MNDEAAAGASAQGGATPENGESPRPLAPWVALGVAVLLLGLIVVLISASNSGDATTGDSPLLGRPAPEAIGALDDGTPFDLAQRKGSWVVLNFFTADCIPCQQEHPELIEFVDQQDELGADGAEFYSVVVNDSPGDVEEFFAENGGDWPVVYPAESSAIDVAFGVAAVPETWIIDPNGVVRVRIISTVDAEALNITMQQLREGAG